MNSIDGQWTQERIARYRERVFTERDRLCHALTDGAARQHAVLGDLLSANAGTAFGREHGFDRIHNLDDFRKSVPIRDYSALSPWVEQMADGRSNVLAAEDPMVYFTSSGTTGAHKKIPITARFMRTSFFPFFYAAWAPLAEHFPRTISAPDAVLNLKHDPVPVAATTASGRPHLGASQVDFGALFGEPLSAEPGTAASWAALPAYVPGDHLENSYLRLRCAVEGDLRCVIGINPAMVAAVPYQLARWWPRIVKEVHDGTLGGRPYRSPNRERANELEWLARRFDPVRPAHIWPNMAAIFCWTSGIASLYLPRLREEFGIGVSVLPAPVAASEGPIGVTLDRHGSAGSLVVTAQVYEFVPADEVVGPDVPTLEPHEVQVGHEYHVIFSHVGGLYRYAVGDVVRVVDMIAGVPRVEYAGRSTLSDVRGERLRESQVIRAMSAALRACGLEIRNVTCRVWAPRDGAARYEFAVAPRSAWSADEIEHMTARLDAALTAAAPRYGAARAAGRLDRPTLRLLDGETFLRDWHEQVGGGSRPAQLKDRLWCDQARWHRLIGTGSGAT